MGCRCAVWTRVCCGTTCIVDHVNFIFFFAESKNRFVSMNENVAEDVLDFKIRHPV